MKERPILFSAPMVRAILEGRKWQTRRVIKPQPFLYEGDDFDENYSRQYWAVIHENEEIARHTCPLGNDGDLLWVRETWQYARKEKCRCPQGSEPMPCDDWLNGTGCRFDRNNVVYGADGQAPCWRSPIHMPRWASRITLEIKDVRAEKLQDISEADAIAEGAQYFQDIPIEGFSYHPPRWSMKKPVSTMVCLSSARMAFANFINELHGGKNWNLKPHSLWDDNPWVWVIEFKRVES